MASQPFHWPYAEFEDANYQRNGGTLFFVVFLLALILLLTILILYLHWMCRCRGSVSNAVAARRTSHAPPQSVVLDDLQLSHQGLDTNSINKLPIILYGTTTSCNVGEEEKEEAEETECCICLGAFQVGDKVKILPVCHHNFHSECVDKWLRTRSSCPLCRASLRLDSAV